MNKIQILGRLVREPEKRTTVRGKDYVIFTVAVNRMFTKDGTCDFFYCKAWDIIAEQILRNFHKGQMIALSGHIQNNMVKKNGVSAMLYELIVEEWYMAGEKKEKQKELESRYDENEVKECLEFGY